MQNKSRLYLGEQYLLALLQGKRLLLYSPSPAFPQHYWIAVGRAKTRAHQVKAMIHLTRPISWTTTQMSQYKR